MCPLCNARVIDKELYIGNEIIMSWVWCDAHALVEMLLPDNYSDFTRFHDMHNLLSFIPYNAYWTSLEIITYIGRQILELPFEQL